MSSDLAGLSPGPGLSFPRSWDFVAGDPRPCQAQGLMAPIWREKGLGGPTPSPVAWRD